MQLGLVFRVIGQLRKGKDDEKLPADLRRSYARALCSMEDLFRRLKIYAKDEI